GVLLLEQFLRPVAQPGVAVAALVADLGQFVPGDAIAVGEDRPVGADLVEARPQGWGGCVLDHDLVPAGGGLLVLAQLHADALEPGLLEPGDCRLDRRHHLGAWLFQAHQQADDPDRLGPAEADQFIAPARARAVVLLVVLGAPGGPFALHLDLAFEDALDAPTEGVFRLLAASGVHEAVALHRGDLTQKEHQADHRVVVEGDVAVGALSRRGRPGPTAPRGLRLEGVAPPPPAQPAGAVLSWRRLC